MAFLIFDFIHYLETPGGLQYGRDFVERIRRLGTLTPEMSASQDSCSQDHIFRREDENARDLLKYPEDLEDEIVRPIPIEESRVAPFPQPNESEPQFDFSLF